MKGSYTIEASLLMVLLIPVLTGILYLGYSLHNEAWAVGKAGEEALKEAGTIAEKWKGEITKTVTKTMAVPGIARKFLGVPETVEGSCTLDNQNPAGTVFRIHSLKKLAGGGT